jgi:hypothetical protein
MILGNKQNRLRKRVNAALLSGNANPREAIFLHKISVRIEEYGNNTRLSDGQAKWLFKILNHLCPTRPNIPSPTTAPAAVPEVSPPSIRFDSKSGQAPSSDFRTQPPSSPVRKDAFADLSESLMSECFGTATGWSS